jgi:hypothetical protein
MPYCTKIRFNGRHYTCYFRESGVMITFSGSPSCGHWHKNLYRDCVKYAGLEIRELLQLG